MEFEKPILMGHSMGAATVMRVGAEYPDLAQAVIMLDPGLPSARGSNGRGHRGPPGAAGRGGPSEPNRISVSMFGDPETLVVQNNYSFEDLVEKGRRDNRKWNDADVKYWALSKKQYHGAYSREMFAVMSGAMNTGDSLPKISVRSLILKADTSEENRAAHMQSVSEMPRVKLVHIDGAGHNLHHDQLERTAKELTEFLSTL